MSTISLYAEQHNGIIMVLPAGDDAAQDSPIYTVIQKMVTFPGQSVESLTDSDVQKLVTKVFARFQNPVPQYDKVVFYNGAGYGNPARQVIHTRQFT